MTVQELLKAAQKLNLADQIRLADELKLLAEQQLQNASPAASSESEPTPIENDPIVGLFGGSPDLSIKAKEILAKEIKPASGFTWKES